VPRLTMGKGNKSKSMAVIRSSLSNMNRVFLSTGSNIGDRAANLRKAADACNTLLGKVLKSSSVYQTAAWGNENQQPFLNQVLELQTALSPQETMQKILELEVGLGRIRNQKWGPRSIDIDILLYGNEVLNESGLHVPHPQLANRRFVLVPLAEIAPEMVHPESKLSISQLLARCADTLEVTPFISDNSLPK
jgi:2-amino-4-hydroxy-6-hydroxymethyldihydropteridine diphosphokinase